MPVTVRSFAKINLGLRIGALRSDGFHELRTVYQTIASHDIVRVQVGRGSGIEIRCEDSRVPKDESNTCYRIVERAMAGLKARGRDNGKPGLRKDYSPTYYAAFLLDPDGNNVEAVCLK